MSADIAPTARRPAGESIRRIVVATDLSEASAGALRLGADIARAFDAELLLVHVLPDLDDPGSMKATLGMEPGDILERRAGEAEGRVRRAESILGRGHIHASVRYGSAAAEIVRIANEAQADLVVLGSHGPTAQREPCAEPVAERVRNRARCPVLVALPRLQGATASSAPPTRSIHGLLVATDLTSRSDAVVRWGRTFAKRLDCPVHVLHVAQTARGQRKALTGLAQPDIIRVGDPGAQIVACAHELGDDLIVLGPTRRWALRRSVGGEVVKRAALPTLTAR